MAQTEAPTLGESRRQQLLPQPNATAPALDPTAGPDGLDELVVSESVTGLESHEAMVSPTGRRDPTHLSLSLRPRRRWSSMRIAAPAVSAPQKKQRLTGRFVELFLVFSW